jgi:haloalkane dehalogenase
MRKGYVETPEGQIHYREVGSGEQTLVYVTPGPAHAWDEVMGFFAARGYRSVAFELPGYGLSDPPPADPTLGYWARRIVDAAERMGLSRYDAVGNHTGAMVVTAMAVNHPDAVRRLVCWGVPLLPPEQHAQFATDSPTVYDEAGVELLSRWQRYWRLAPEGDKERLARRGLAGALSSDGGILAHRSLTTTDLPELIKALPVPMLAVAGRTETLYDHTIAAAALSPLITFKELGDAGMFMVGRHAESFVEMADAFLSSD